MAVSPPHPGPRAVGAPALLPGTRQPSRATSPPTLPCLPPQPRARRRGARKLEGGQARGAGGWEMEKQTLFSACLWREGSRGPRARRVKQFQTRMSVCFSLEQRRKTPKALGFSSLNILFWKVPYEEVEEMKKRLHECKRPFPSSDSKMGQPGWGWREASSRGGEGLVVEGGGGSWAGGHFAGRDSDSHPVPGAVCWDWCLLGGSTGCEQWHARLPAWRGGGLGILLLCLCSSCPPRAPNVDAVPPNARAGTPSPPRSVPGLCPSQAGRDLDYDLSAVSEPDLV